MVTARNIVVHGRVQGVFFRDWTVDTARALGLGGWVRNLSDGTVEAHLEGEDGPIERMVEALHDGPPRAEPSAVESRAAQVEGFERFERR